MWKIVSVCFLSLFLCSCRSMYYGYLPGMPYTILEPRSPIYLHGKTFNLEFHDSRGTIIKIDCSKHTLDRNTELEGKLGMQYLRACVVAMIENSNGKIDEASPNKVVIELEGLSFKLVGAIYIVAHGFVQFKASSAFLNKTYCSDLTDHDKDSPVKWHSFVSRKTATALIVSASMRRAVEEFVTDLAHVK